MSKYANPWSGDSQFYRGKVKKATKDKDYELYCQRKKNKNKILPYEVWGKRERIKSGIF